MPYGNINVDTVTTSTTGGVLGAGNASTMKNRIINGAMVIDQRNAGASSSSASNAVYFLDRWAQNNNVGSSKFTVQQNAGSVTPPVGFTNYLGVTSSSAYSITGSNILGIYQYIEGFNIADLGWGTANAKTVTLSFQVYSSLTGTFGGSIGNANNYFYPFSYSIPAANTWTTISVTVTGPTSGTWLTTNGIGAQIFFGLGVVAAYSGTAGSWSSNVYYSATGATSVVGTSGATFYITGVQLEVGSSATGFEYRQYGTELVLCQRYYGKYQGTGSAVNPSFAVGISSSATLGVVSLQYPQIMRATPTITVSQTALTDSTVYDTTVTSIASNYGGPASSRLYLTASGGGMTTYRTVFLIALSGTSGYVDFSAEL